MKKLNDYKDEIHKCSKCGLCQSVCPVYQITGNDCSVSRGKFIMLNGILKGDLILNKNVNKYLDMCMKCNACKNFCPSGINAREIFTAAKAQYFERSGVIGKLTKIFQSSFMFNLFMESAKIAANTYRFLRFDKIAKKFYPIFLKMGWLGRKVILANEFVSINTVVADFTSVKKQGQSPDHAKVVYFKGCVNEYLNPRSKIAAENILKRMGVEILPADFQCCGVPFLSGGNAKQFAKQAEYNLAQIPDNFDFFLTDCASCQNAFKEYENYIEDEKLLEKLKKINEKSINVVNFIIKNIQSIEFSEKVSFTFHKPCHLEDLNFLKDFLSKAKNVEYIEMKDFDKCCGFSGEFAIKNPELSEKISSEKALNTLATGADYILTSCPACILGLQQGLIKEQKLLTPINFVEFIELGDFKLNCGQENQSDEKQHSNAFC